MPTAGLDIGIAAVIGAIAGAIAALIAPWAKWGVEKRKRKLLWRKEFIKDCKRIIKKRNFIPELFIESPHYSTLKPYLSDSLQKDIKKRVYTPGKMPTPKQKRESIMKEFRIKKRLFDEINILEKKWGLI